MPGFIDIDLQKRICADLGRHIDHTAACDEFLQTLHATVARLQKRSRGKANPAVAAETLDAIMDQYRSLTKHQPSRRTRRS